MAFDGEAFYQISGARCGPAMVNFESCAEPVKDCLDLYDRRVIEAKCTFPKGHAGPHALVNYAMVSYESAALPNKASDVVVTPK